MRASTFEDEWSGSRLGLIPGNGIALFIDRRRWEEIFLVLVLPGAEHQVLDGFAGVFAFVEDELHLLGDGHFDVVLAGEAEGGAGGEDAFCDFAAQAFENLGEIAALAERLTDSPVAAERAGAGEDQVAYAGEAGEGFTAAPAGYGEACDFGETAGH